MTIKISKDQLYFFINLLFLCLSFFNPTLLALWLIGVTIVNIYFKQTEGAIEAFILIQLRSLLNPGIAVDISTVSLVKWGCVYALSLYLLFVARIDKENRIEARSASVLIIAFSAFAAVSSLLVSSYPLVSLFKLASYCIPMLAIMYGVSGTRTIKWINYITAYFGVFVLFSIFLVALPVGYLRNGRFFQGFFNHPNLFAVVIALFLAGFLYKKDKKIDLKVIAGVVLCLVLIFLSKSRTGMFSALLIIAIYLLQSKIGREIKIFTVSLLGIGIACALFMNEGLLAEILGFVNKGNTISLVGSRRGQIELALLRFGISPIIGTGFNVPYYSGIRSFSFSFDLIVENGNLILALLGDVGILGLILFVIAYGRIYLIGKGKLSTIFFAPFLVCMGEMAFFSTNNFAILLYLYFAIYAFDSNEAQMGRRT